MTSDNRELLPQEVQDAITVLEDYSTRQEKGEGTVHVVLVIALEQKDDYVSCGMIHANMATMEKAFWYLLHSINSNNDRKDE